MKAVGRDDGATADADCPETLRGDMGVNSRSAQAGRMAGFSNAISDFRSIMIDRLHFIGPTLRRRDAFASLGDQLERHRRALNREELRLNGG